jgi:hypothetical protein
MSVGDGCGGWIFFFLSFPFSSLPSVPSGIVSILVVEKTTGWEGG